MLLSIIIPCFNEEKTIKTLISKLFSAKITIPFEVIIIDDGSKIKLKPIVKDLLEKHDEILFFRLSKNMGKGYAVKFGIKSCKGDLILIQDADLEYFPSDIPKLLQPILDNKADVVYGSRFMEFPEGMSIYHFYGNHLLTKLTNFLYRTQSIGLTDMETGYKLFPKSVIELQNFDVTSFDLEPILTILFYSHKLRVLEVPIKYRYRIKGNAKIHIGDGIQAALLLILKRYFSKSQVLNYFYDVYVFYIKNMIGKSTNLLKNITKLRFEIK